MSTATAAADMVNHPPHYQGYGIECIDVIEAYDLGYHLGNAAKYLVRAGRKGDASTDIGKAVWYVRRWLETNPHLPWAPGADDWKTPDQIAAAFGLSGPRRGLLVAILDIALPIEDETAKADLAAPLQVLVVETEGAS